MSSILVARGGEHVTVRIQGVLEVRNRCQFRDALRDALEDGGRRFTIDLAHCSYIDGSGLGVLVSAIRSIRLAGGTLHVINANEDLRTLFELTKLDKLFLVEGTPV